MDNYSEGLATGMALNQGNHQNCAYPCYAYPYAGYGMGNGGFGFGGEWGGLIGLLIVASLFGGNGWGFGGNRSSNCATQADVRAAVDQQTLISKIDQQTYGLADSFNSLNNTLNSNFRGVDNAICNLGYNIATQFAGVDKAFCTLGYQNQAGFNSLSHQISDCCCETQRAIDSVKYENAKNTCDIIRAGQDNTNAIISWLTQEKISGLQAENSALKAQISNDKQSAYLLNELKPCPIPAYLTCNPNAPYGLGYGVGFNNSGCGCGCGGF